VAPLKKLIAYTVVSICTQVTAHSGAEQCCSVPMASTSYEEVSMDLLLAGMLIGILLSATFNRR